MLVRLCPYRWSLKVNFMTRLTKMDFGRVPVAGSSLKIMITT